MVKMKYEGNDKRKRKEKKKPWSTVRLSDRCHAFVRTWLCCLFIRLDGGHLDRIDAQTGTWDIIRMQVGLD